MIKFIKSKNNKYTATRVSCQINTRIPNPINSIKENFYGYNLPKINKFKYWHFGESGNDFMF